MLHKIEKIRGFHILAADGEIGHVDEFLVDERDWSVRYLVVDTSNWIGGRSVLISSEAVESHRFAEPEDSRQADARRDRARAVECDSAPTLN